MKKVIFFDVDGVLNCMPYNDRVKCKDAPASLNNENIKRLAEIQKLTDADLVICSTWRQLDVPDDENVYPMWKFLVSSLQEFGLKISDKTPDTKKGRPADIKQWLDMQNEDMQFVILDDDYSKCDYDKYNIGKHLVQTKYFCVTEEDGGLQEYHVQEALKILLKAE